MSDHASILLRGIAWDHPRAMDPLLGTLPAYRASHPGVDVTWRARSLLAFGDQPLEELARDHDLLLIDHPFVGQAAATRCLLAFDEVLASSDLADAESGALGPSYRSYTWDGQQWALPIDGAAQVMALRPDLLPPAADPPATWPEVLSLAEKVRIRDRWLAIPLGPTDVVPALYTLSNALGEAPFGSRDRVLPRAHGRAVLDLLAALRDAAHPASPELDPPTLLDAMAERDDIACAPVLFGYANYARPGFRRHRLRFADLPGIVGSTLGGVGIAVSATCPHPVEAARYAAWLASGSVQRSGYVRHGGQPGHGSAWSDPSADAATGGFLAATRRTMEGAWVRARFPGYDGFQKQAGAILHAFVRGETAIEATLDQLDDAYRRALEGWPGITGADPTVGRA